MSRLTFFAISMLLVGVVAGDFWGFLFRQESKRAAGHQHSGNQTTHVPAPTTTHAPLPSAQFLIGSHNYVYVILDDGCYALHLSNQEIHALKSHHDSTAIKTQLLRRVVNAKERHEIDHHTIDSEHHEVQTSCQDLPIFRLAITG